MSEINVVPYIDVMLVLVIFMVVAADDPEIKVELPAADSEAIEVVIRTTFWLGIDAEGQYFLNIGEKSSDVADDGVAGSESRGAQPSIKVLIEGDQAVTYGYVISAMDRLKNAGIEDVGLVTQPRSSESIVLRSAILPTISRWFCMERCLGCCATIGNRHPQVAAVEPLYIAAKVVNVAPKPKQTAKAKPKPPAQVSETVCKRYRFPSHPPQSLSQMSPSR